MEIKVVERRQQINVQEQVTRQPFFTDVNQPFLCVSCHTGNSASRKGIGSAGETSRPG